MSDMDRVREAFASGALLHPVAERPSSVDLALALGELGGAGPDLTPAARELLRHVTLDGRPPRHTVFVLVDGLGCNLVEALQPDAFLRRHTVTELRAVFPSTTAAALTSLATARWPAAHAVSGWFTHLPAHDCTALVLPFVTRDSKRPLGELGIAPESVFPLGAQTEHMSAETHLYQPRAIAGSVYSAYQGGAAGSAYDDLDGAVDAITRRIAAADGPSYHYFYIPDVDAAEHRHGHEASEVTATLLRVQSALEALATNLTALPDRARILISADHGMLTVPDTGKHTVSPGDPLLDLLHTPFSGEPRVPMFHVKQVPETAFVELFLDRYGADFALLSRDEAAELQLFGPEPLAAETARRVGDYIAVALEPSVLLYAPDGLERLRGFHAGLTPGEMRIPLIIA